MTILDSKINFYSDKKKKKKRRSEEVLPIRNHVKAEGVEWQHMDRMGGVRQPLYPFTVIYEQKYFCKHPTFQASISPTALILRGGGGLFHQYSYFVQSLTIQISVTSTLC